MSRSLKEMREKRAVCGKCYFMTCRCKDLRYLAAADMIDEWLKDDTDHDAVMWPLLERREPVVI